jgi:uncharacterized protein (TIGR01777 family)
MRIVVTGGTGFLGSALVEALARQGHEVVVLSRHAPEAPPPGQVWRDRKGVTRAAWSVEETGRWAHVLDGADVIVNLAGESIAARRWTPAQKLRLAQSRLGTVRALGQALAGAAAPPRLLASASAVGYYGSRDAEILTEDSPPGRGFLSDLCVQWEEAARAAAPRGTRVVLLRTGLVLDRGGGALGSMIVPFRLGLGGPLGSGQQYMPWIHRSDWVQLVSWLLERQDEGPFNLTAPEPVTNEAFTRALAEAVRRPAFLRAPAFALRLALGEMADALLLSGQRAIPARAQALGFRFTYATLPAALHAIFA